VVLEGDRALLPLPLHHVYPMTVGMLTPLAAGAAVVFPEGISGPELATALRDGGITHLVGVPRLYTTLIERIRTQIKARGGLAARCFPGLLALSTVLARVLSGYGLTETSPIPTFNRRGASWAWRQSLPE